MIMLLSSIVHRPSSIVHRPSSIAREAHPTHMDFTLNEEQRAVQKLTYDFAQNEIAPYAREHDEQGKINWNALKKMGPLGLLGGPIPEEYGGSGFDSVSLGLICEEIERDEAAFR